MRLLIDNNLSPQLVALLVGHDVEHVGLLGLGTASDALVMERARTSRRVVVSADTDFGQLLATSRATSPSVVLIRRQTGRRVEALADLLLANLPAVHEDLLAGAVVVITGDELRVRRLPILAGT